MATRLSFAQALHVHPDQVAFWQRWISEHPEPTMVSRDLIGVEAAEGPTDCAVEIPAATAAAVGRITGNDPTLLRIVFTAVLALVAARATDSGQVSLVSAGRQGTASVPLCLRIEPASPFRSLLADTRAEYREAVAHTDLPVGHLFAERDSDPGDFSLSVSGVEVPAVPDPPADRPFASALPFRVVWSDAPRVELDYRTDLFTEQTGRRLVGAFVGVLTAGTTDPDVVIGTLLQADPDERSAFAAHNRTERAWPETATLHSFLERQAVAVPDRIAIVDDGTTFAQLNRRANRLAHRLRSLGVGPGAVVGVCLPRSPLLLVTLYGVLKAGAAYLPVDPTLPLDRIAYLTEHSDTRIGLGTEATRHLLAGVDTFVDLEDEASFAGSEDNPAGGAEAGDLCYVIYTSGSTGRPKGVAVEHRAIVNRLWWMQEAYPLGPDDVILHKTPFTFDVSVWEIFWWSLAGAAVCTLPSGDERDPARIHARVVENSVTTMHFVPSMLRAHLRYLDASGVAGMSSVRQVFASGEALPGLTATTFAKLVTGARLINLYGPTEAAVDVSHFDCTDLDPHRPLPIGRPIHNIRLHVLTRAGTEAPVGTPGELHIAGVGLARGYLNEAELTRERFVPDSVSGSGRMYRTGDLSRRLENGDLEYLGRLDDQVKIRGYRIEPAEIEHVGAGSPGVRECAVLARADEAGDPYLCAYVVADQDFTEEAFRARLAAALPAYMIPAFVLTVDDIRTNHNGKRDAAGLPDPRRRSAERPFTEPRTDRERQLAEIWERALGADRVGVHDNFFALGGDSIKGVVVLAALRERGLELTFQELFAHPSIAEVADLVRAAPSAPVVPGAMATPVDPFDLLPVPDRSLVPSTAVAAYPLSGLQAGLVYEVLRTGDIGLYHDVACYHVPGTIDLAGFRTALAEVVARHPIFRTSFHPEGFSVPVQIVHASVPLPLEVTDLSELPEPDQQAVLAAFSDEELQRGFRPGSPDLVRVHLHLLGRRGYQYSVSYHAAALDGWSVGNLHNDLFTTYFAILNGEPRPEPAAGPGYPAFLALEREAVAAAHQRAFWTELLDGSQSTRLPRLGGGPADEPPGVLMRDVPLPDGLSDAVLRTATELGVPVKSVLLAAHVAVMAFVAGTDDVLVGYEHSGRPEVLGAEELAGLFLNTVPFRVRLEQTSWAELVRQVYALEADLLPHRRYPMGEMKRLVGARGPLFESIFNFTHFHQLKDLVRRHGFQLVRSEISSRTEFPFRAEFWQDAFSDELGLALHLERGEFRPEQIERIAGYYLRALQRLTSRPQERHTDCDLLGVEETTQLARVSTGPRQALGTGTVLDVIAEQVALNPTRIAVSDREQRLDYRSLDERSDRVVTALRRAGVKPGDVVAVAMERGLSWAVSVLAVLKAGAVYLPQQPADPPARLAAMVRRSGCRHLLLDGSQADVVAEKLAAELGPGAEQLSVLTYAEAGRAPRTETPVRPKPEDGAYLIFTSGSTGEPKGALIPHRGLLNHLLAKRADLKLDRDDRIAQTASQSFDISVWQLLASWVVGGHSVIVDDELMNDLAAFLDTVVREEISILELVPSYLDAVLDEMQARPAKLVTVRCVLVTGETMPPALTHRWFARYGIPLVNAYGPTEASDDVTHHVITAPVSGDRVPVGRPVLNTQLHVVDRHGRTLPIGSYGEILVTGAGVGLGYVNDPERTAAAFPPNRYDDTSSRLYRTGDIGRWLPTGELDCAGRLDHQVKVRGHRIELTEIEGALARVEGIDNAVVMVRVITGQKLLVAFYTGTADEVQLRIRQTLAASLPAYLLPDLVVRLPSFPLNQNGKVDRGALERQDVLAEPERRLEPPADELEAEVLRVYAEVLAVPAETIGVTDNFFDRGGHSLGAMRVTSRLGSRAALRDVVAWPTARELASRIRERTPGPRPMLTDLTTAAGLSADRNVVTVVCLPFAGGRAVSYLPVARALHAGVPAIRTLGVDLPGRSANDPRSPVGARQLAAELAAEIAQQVTGDLVLLGHSAGSATALLVGQALRRAGRPLTHFVVVAAALRSSAQDDIRDRQLEGLIDTEVFTWLTERAGLSTVQRLSAVERADLAGAFRTDLVTAQQSRAAAFQDAEEFPLGCDVTVLLAVDDPVTRDVDEDIVSWGSFGTGLRVAWAESGAHYLNTTRPDFLAEQIRDALKGGGR
jgi:amino acid adenylation domain-containing protein